MLKRAGLRLKAVERAVLGLELVDQGRRVGLAAGRLGDQDARREQAAAAVDAGAEPVAHRGEVARGEAGVEVRQVAAQRGMQLGGIEVAEGVGREVAEEADRPVDVLQQAAPGIGHGAAEVGEEAVVPGGLEVADGEVAARPARARGRSAA